MYRDRRATTGLLNKGQSSYLPVCDYRYLTGHIVHKKLNGAWLVSISSSAYNNNNNNNNSIVSGSIITIVVKIIKAERDRNIIIAYLKTETGSFLTRKGLFIKTLEV
jgi:hypothetical protein